MYPAVCNYDTAKEREKKNQLRTNERPTRAPRATWTHLRSDKPLLRAHLQRLLLPLPLPQIRLILVRGILDHVRRDARPRVVDRLRRQRLVVRGARDREDLWEGVEVRGTAGESETFLGVCVGGDERSAGLEGENLWARDVSGERWCT